jgi:hypothetical protein
MIIDSFLPRDRVYIPAFELSGVVTQVRITTDGVEYFVRYIDDRTIYESWFYDFEVKSPQKLDA